MAALAETRSLVKIFSFRSVARCEVASWQVSHIRYGYSNNTYARGLGRDFDRINERNSNYTESISVDYAASFSPDITYTG